MTKNTYTKLFTGLKIVSLILLSLLILASTSLLFSGVVFLILLITYRLLDRQKFWLNFKAVLIFFVFILVGRLLLVHNLTLQENLQIAVLFFVRMGSITFLMFSFIKITSILEIARFLSFLPRQMRLLIIITFSFLPIIQKEFENIYIAQKVRHFRFNPIQFYKSFFPIFVPLLHRVLNRAEQIAVVIESRG